jgi:hypothetical protein
VAEPQYYNTVTMTIGRAGMDLNFVEPSEIPVPPDQVRIRQLNIQPMRDGARLTVEIGLTPFQEPPTIEVVILDSLHQAVASTSIIEAMTHHLSFTMHLQDSGSEKAYQAVCTVRYIDGPIVDERELTLKLG